MQQLSEVVKMNEATVTTNIFIFYATDDANTVIFYMLLLMENTVICIIHDPYIVMKQMKNIYPNA